MELKALKEYIVLNGLPCLVGALRVEGSWSCLDLLPLPGWLHLSPQAVVAECAARGDHYHVSLGYNVDPTLLEVIRQRWVGSVTVVEVDHIRDSNVAILAWRGLGADSEVWAALAQGYPRRVGFGLHISM